MVVLWWERWMHVKAGKLATTNVPADRGVDNSGCSGVHCNSVHLGLRMQLWWIPDYTPPAFRPHSQDFGSHYLERALNFESHDLDFEFHSLDCGSHSLDCEFHSMNFEFHSLDCGPHSFDSGSHSMECGPHVLDCRPHSMDCGPHSLDCGSHSVNYVAMARWRTWCMAFTIDYPADRDWKRTLTRNEHPCILVLSVNFPGRIWY